MKYDRYKNKDLDIHIYKINENKQLPRGLEFNKDSEGHVSLTATQDMSWNDMIIKLQMVSEMLEHHATIRIGI